MEVDRLVRPGARDTDATTIGVDWLVVWIGVGAVVGSGTPLGPAALGVAGVVAVAKLLTGHPIESGWVFLVAPPLAYAIFGVANGQLAGVSNVASALTTDFRVLGVIPLMLFASTHRLAPESARRTLVALATVITLGLLLAVGLNALTSISGYWPFSSHHAVGFASAAVVVTVLALPSDTIPHRRLLLIGAAVALIASGSRSGVIAAFGAMCSIPLLRVVMGQGFRWSVSRGVRMCIAIAAVAGVAQFVAPRSVERVTETVGSVIDQGVDVATFGRGKSGQGVSVAERNVAVRLEVWDVLADNVAVDGVLRFDAGTVDDILSGADRTLTHEEFAAHNIYLQLAVELGWLGMLAYAGLSTVGVRMLMRQRPPSTRVAIAALWIAVLVFGITSNSLVSPAVMVPAGLFLMLLAQKRHDGATA